MLSMFLHCSQEHSRISGGRDCGRPGDLDLGGCHGDHHHCSAVQAKVRKT